MAEKGRTTSGAEAPGPKAVLAAAWRTVWAPALLAPVLAAGLIVFLACGRHVPFNRPLLQLASVVILPVAMLIAIVRWAVTREGYFLWLAGLAAALTCAETHVAGASAGIYVAIAALALVAWLKRAAMAAQFAYRPVATLLGMAMLAYLIAESVDRNVWAWLPSEGRFADAVEETMEVIGHCLVTALAIISRKAR